MGDVALTTPVVHCLAEQNPELRITVLTKEAFAPLFAFAPSNVEVMGVNLDNYSGIFGLERLYKELRNRNFDQVADFHDVLRTKYLRMRFRMNGVKVAVIDKGRAEKKALLGHGTDRPMITHSTERYRLTLRQLGYDVALNFKRLYNPADEDFGPVESRVGRKPEGERWIGIAPFAAHEGKIYPLDCTQLIAQWLADRGMKVFIFGSGEEERHIVSGWQKQNIKSVCGKVGGLKNELLLMSQLDCMIAMDSANMHMAAIVGTPVVSIWGATHPKMGFSPINQPMENCVQKRSLLCRPCSVYGNKKCRYGDYRCMTHLAPHRVFKQVLKVLGEPVEIVLK